MERMWRSCIFILLGTAAVACNRNGKSDGVSFLTIQTPNMNRIASSHMRNPFPLGKIQCYGISVRGGGISATLPNQCTPETGLLAGFVSSGQTLTAQVPKGISITVDLYLYLAPSGSSCPNMTAPLPDGLAPDIYLVASVPNVSTANETTTVDIPFTFNGVNITQSGATSCVARAPSTAIEPAYQKISGGEAVFQSGGIKLKARLGNGPQSAKLSAGGYSLTVK